MGLTGFNRARREAAEMKSEKPVKKPKSKEKEPVTDDRPLEETDITDDGGD
ncbi:MAG: hypothetical protein KGZ88_11825 [Methylomicrobium sp.]|nr:hypothetical protein [Methylomicrobium sp.]